MSRGHAYQAAAVHAQPYAVVAILEPSAHAVPRETILHRKSLKAAGRGNIKNPVAIVIKPYASCVIFMYPHGPPRCGTEQTLPFSCLSRPPPARFFPQTVIGQNPEGAFRCRKNHRRRECFLRI